jgi:hypothetical protein
MALTSPTDNRIAFDNTLMGPPLQNVLDSVTTLQITSLVTTHVVNKGF